MEEIVLKTSLGESEDLYISPIDRETYEDQIADNSLGGESGYFVVRSRRTGFPRLEILAKVPTIEAATALFALLAGTYREA